MSYLDQKPTVGRIVHYWEESDGPYAAIVTHVHSGTETVLSLQVFTTGDIRSKALIQKGDSDTMKGGSYWEWPPRAV